MSNWDWATDLGDRLRKAAGEARRRGGRVNVSARVNRAVATNAGRRGGVQAAHSRQTVRIVQDGRESATEEENNRI